MIGTLAFSLEKKTLNKNLSLAINLISSLVAFGANIIINFFLSPYIVKELGVEANGYITLANNFVSYASLATIALNSMAGRFITIKIYNNDIHGANIYYSSLTFANMFFSLIMLIPSIGVIWYLENLINISSHLLWDVKLLFFFLFINFLISTAFSSWGTATFVTNRLYLQSLRTMSSQVLRVIVIIGLFILFNPSVYYVGIGTLISTLYFTCYSFYYKKKLLPDLRFNKESFRLIAIIELIKSGIWNTITQAGVLLLSGLDLLIANIFIGSKEMGLLALSKILPNVMTQLSGTITSVFTPTLTIKYAEKDFDGLKIELKKSMKLLGVIFTIPLSILIGLGKEFYVLWVPSENSDVLHVLSIFAILGFVFTSGIQSLYNVFTVVNKLKLNSILILLSGVISTAIVLILLKTTNLNMFAVAAVSSGINLIRNLAFTVPFAARYLNLKWYTFFPEVFYSVISVIVSLLISYIVKKFITIDSWTLLVICSVLIAVSTFVINCLIILNNKERAYLVDIFKRKILLTNKK
ncbi:Polysaccharide biosynthesis protein [Mycobacteroides abscessus subsp. abscessus]|nr:Polysaccharide biosynthesis protein [Mycobacteroides abscessus subsp. abscessus]